MTHQIGTVYLVGAGPGDPGLITVRGQELLRRADTVIHDNLVAEELVSEARIDANVISVTELAKDRKTRQERVHELLVEHARRGQLVVRLKGGDPFVFGRGYEEVCVCRDAGVPCVVIPGVSSALAAPAALGIPLTDRRLVRSIAIIAGQTASDSQVPPIDYKAVASIDTIVVMMGLASLPEICRSLIDGGKRFDTPAISIERATMKAQRVVSGTLDNLANAVKEQGLRSPVVTVVGEVAALADEAVSLARTLTAD